MNWNDRSLWQKSLLRIMSWFSPSNNVLRHWCQLCKVNSPGQQFKYSWIMFWNILNYLSRLLRMSSSYGSSHCQFHLRNPLYNMFIFHNEIEPMGQKCNSFNKTRQRKTPQKFRRVKESRKKSAEHHMEDCQGKRPSPYLVVLPNRSSLHVMRENSERATEHNC